MDKLHVLVVDDEAFTRDFFVNLLDPVEYKVFQATSGEDGLEMCGTTTFDLVLLDLKMPGMSGLDVLKEIKKINADTSVLIMTGHGTIDSAVEAMKLGAEDYLAKPFDNLEELKLVIERVIDYKRLRDENRFLRSQLKPEGIIGDSGKMRKVYQMVSKVAPLSSTILITGESGTGKELVARSIHNLSRRSGSRFVAINCGGLPDNLLESTLFGHEKGAFTGAVRSARGYFEEASGGTLFLDEIGETSPSLQIRLLRVLQEKEFERVGGTTPIETDVRIIAATNRELSRLVAAKKFREDLYYRINVINILLPPLRERTDDIPLLANHFLKRYNAQFERNISCFSRKAMETMLAYSWPGNVRELENVVERTVALEEEGEITLDDLPPRLFDGNGMYEPLARTVSFREARGQFERNFLIETLKRTGGNISRAARECGLARQNFHKKLAKYNVDVKRLINDHETGGRMGG